MPLLHPWIVEGPQKTLRACETRLSAQSVARYHFPDPETRVTVTNRENGERWGRILGVWQRIAEPRPVFHEETYKDQGATVRRIGRTVRSWAASAAARRGWKTRKRLAAARTQREMTNA